MCSFSILHLSFLFRHQRQKDDVLQANHCYAIACSRASGFSCLDLASDNELGNSTHSLYTTNRGSDGYQFFYQLDSAS
jgi:hypothetical protein